MKRILFIITALTLSLAVCSCWHIWDAAMYSAQGYLYTDSVEQEPVVGDTLNFHVDFRGNKVATVVTDTNGFWHFRFQQPDKSHGYTQIPDAKFQYAYPNMTAIWHDSILLQLPMLDFVMDTLYLYTR